MIKSSDAYLSAITGKSRRTEIKTVIYIIDPDIQYGAASSSSAAPWTSTEELHKKKEQYNRFATLEPGMWILDGSVDLFPEDYKVTGVPYALNELSGNDGSFENDQWVQQSFSDVGILQAFSVYFPTNPLDGVPEDFKVEVLSAGQVFYSKEITGNRATELSFEGFTVQTPDTIKITCTKWSLPGRRMRIAAIIPGTYEEWNGRMLASFNVTQQSNFSCLTIPYGTLTLSMNNKSRRFEPRSKNGLFQSIEDRQGVEAHIGVLLPDGAIAYKKLGVFYQSGDGWKTGDNSLTMQWSLVDIIGLVCDRTYIPPATLPTTLKGWIASVVAQLGENFEALYHVDPGYENLAVTAVDKEAVSGKKCGDIIRWACMATGTWPRADAETGYLTAEPLWNEGNKVLLRNLNNYPTMKANESIAALIFHLSDESEYVVSGNSASSEKIVTIENPFIHTTAQALSAARLILSCYGGNVIETTGRGDPASEIGDVDTIWLDESQATTARRMMQSFQYQNGVLQACQSKLLQADGSYLYSRSVVLTESGTWTPPAGVVHLRIAVGQGGQGGMKGQDGWVKKTPRGEPRASGYGEDGSPGAGGKVWHGTININAGQPVTVSIGAGGKASSAYGIPGTEGGETTFGAYSSANGQHYANGFTDINSGRSFARTGVAVPLGGTSDGGAGGKGGEPGRGEWKQADLHDDRGQIIGKYWYFDIVTPPGPGADGADGAGGFVLVSWDIEEEAET